MSPDFFSFFSQTVRLLEEDPSIYCISAWNDQVSQSISILSFNPPTHVGLPAHLSGPHDASQGGDDAWTWLDPEKESLERGAGAEVAEP